jgi:hypothetical membrane protein
MMKVKRSLLRQPLAAALWLSSIQYFIVQVIVASKWSRPPGFSLLHNTISDLGNTQCGAYGAHYVCSPLHDVMNGSFIILGITMIIGAYIYKRDIAGVVNKLGFGSVALGAIGIILVGLFPENTISGLHITGAALVFIFGNVGMILLGCSLTHTAKLLRWFSILSGIVGLIALILFYTRTYLAIDEGGMERITAYPLTIWLIVFGLATFLKNVQTS